jgi:nucleolar pre-ribosomal-associated protein 1
MVRPKNQTDVKDQSLQRIHDIPRTIEYLFHHEHISTLFQILKLYDRTGLEDNDPEHIPADLAHHFLLAICTRPGIGICFKDHGWYYRESDGGEDPKANDDDENEPTYQKGGKIYNKILANILKSLKVNEDVRQQELALRIMSACPELVAGYVLISLNVNYLIRPARYWSGAALTLEPRLSSKWLANISFFGSVISLSVPLSAFHLPNSVLFQPSPPPLFAIIENIFPSVNTKSHFSKGLQSGSGLVQHCTAIALAKCLAKYEEVVRLFQEIEEVLGEDEAEGQWNKRRKDIERETRRRVPDFQVVVAFSQQKPGDAQTDSPNLTKGALLLEAAQRLLWMYHRCLTSVVAEVRFDVGKLLQNFSLEIRSATAESGQVSAADKLHMVRQLHVLRLLKDSDQFNWSGKMGTSSMLIALHVPSFNYFF